MDWRETCSPRAPEGREFSAGQNLPSLLRGTGTVPSPRAPPTPSPVPAPPLPAPPTHPPTQTPTHTYTHTHPHTHTHTHTHTGARARSPGPGSHPHLPNLTPPPTPTPPRPSPAARGARGGVAVSAPAPRRPLGHRSRPGRRPAALPLGVRPHQPCPRKARELADNKERAQTAPKGPPEPDTAARTDPRRGRGSPRRMHE